MKKKFAILTLCALLGALRIPAEAQQAGKIPWIGYLAGTGSGPSLAFIQGLRPRLCRGQEHCLCVSYGGRYSDRYASLAAELVQLKVDIIVADYTSAALAAKKTTNTIPIVMTIVTDPVGTELVASLARPGGNVTGLTNISGELGGKALELLKETAPKLNRVAILRTAGGVADD